MLPQSPWIDYILRLVGRGRVVRPMAMNELVADARQTTDPENILMFMEDHAGYVREAAALRAGECLLPQTLPGLIRRINDWVPQVREAALSSVAQFVLADRLEDVVAALPEIAWLRMRSRADHTQFVETLEQWIDKHPRRPKLTDPVVWDNPRVGRAYFALELRHPSPDLASVIDGGLQSRDRVVRQMACELIQRAGGADKSAYARRLLGMRQRWLKYQGLRYLAEAEAGDARRMAADFLLDPYLPLRDLSEHISGIEPDAFVRIVRNALRNDTMSAARRAVAVGLCGRRKYAECESDIRALLAHDNANLCGAALLALYRLSPERYEPLVKQALLLGETGKWRAATTAAQDGMVALTPVDWRAIVTAAPISGTAKTLPRLARRYGKWAWLGVSLELTERETLRQIGIAGVEGWLRAANRSFRVPTAEERAWIGRLLDGANLKPCLLGELRLHAAA
jgi:HEAT repeat protein